MSTAISMGSMGSVSRGLSLLRTCVAYEMRKASAFRVGFLVKEVVRGVDRAAVMAFVYVALFASSSTGIIRGWTLPQMLQYLVLMATAHKILFHERALNLADQIFEGYITKFTVMPMRYFTLVLARWIQFSAVQLGVAAFFWCLGALLLPRWWPMPVSLVALAEALTLIVLASYCFMLLYFIMNTMAFWLGMVWTLLAMSRMVTSFLMGDPIPVSLYPDSLRRVLEWLFPYWAMSGPIDIFLGRAGLPAFLKGMLVLSATIVVLQVASLALWRRGLRQYGGSGM